MNVDAVLAEADKVADKGSAEWLAQLFVAFANEVGPEGVSPEAVDALVRRLVATYVRRSTTTTFAKMVQTMRTAQKQFFATKSNQWLDVSRREERAVDKWVEAALKAIDHQKTLFPIQQTRPDYE